MSPECEVLDREGHVRRLYANAMKGDLARAVEELAPSAVWGVVRPLSEVRVEGRAAILDYLTKVAREAPSDGEIELERVAVADDVVFALHVEARGTPREHRHVLVFKLDSDRIGRVWELTLGGPESEAGVSINIPPVG